MTDRPRVRVFIYGSCVTRDSFEYFDSDRFELVEYVARQSLVSAFAAPTHPLLDTSSLSSQFQRRLLNLDARSGLPDRLREQADQTDLVLWDIFDERLGYFLRSRGRVVTNTVEALAHARRTGTEPTEQLIPFGSPRHRAAFVAELESFAALLDETGLRDKLVMVAPEWAERTDEGELTPSSFGLTAERANDISADYLREIQRIVRPVLAIGPTDTTAASDHRWGVAPFHYVPRVYEQITAAVESLTGAGTGATAPARPRADHRHPDQAPQVAVVGRGFVGTAVADALRERGAIVTTVPAPRLSPVAPGQIGASLTPLAAVISELAVQLQGCHAVVNAAGRAEPGSDDVAGLLAANGVLPALLARSAERGGVPRLIHISSAAVQGRRRVLDSSTELRPFSPYSYSKAVGEAMALRNHPGTVVYRPAGVQGVAREASRRLVAAASSPVAWVAAPGRGNSPQALVENVADAAAFLALTTRDVPRIVHHPTEGITVGELFELLTATQPRQVPAPVAGATLRLLGGAARVVPALRARVRRLEVMWQGQDQAPSWLTDAGWAPPVGPDGWRRLGEQLA